MIIFRYINIFVIFFLTITSNGFSQSPIHRSAYHDYRVVKIVEGLEHPWAIAFLPTGDMLITEQPGRLRIFRNGVLVAGHVPGVPKVFYEGQGGLMDVVLHPEFSSNHLLYLSYSKPYANGNGSTTAVVRGQFINDRLENVEEVFEANSQGRGHYGSRLAFDTDGFLFITVGDRMVSPSGHLEKHPAQDISNSHGTVNRIKDDGSVPENNPFASQQDAQKEIWSFGHRNPQGLVVDHQNRNIWITEHGPKGGDELNLIKPGLNYGWPVVGYGVNYRGGTAIHKGTMSEGMEHPVHVWVPSTGVSGLMLYTGNRFPDWRGNLFAGGLSGQQVARLSMDGHQVLIEETLVHRMGRIRDVRQGLDGYIYIAIDGNKEGELTPIYRLEPVEEKK